MSVLPDHEIEVYALEGMIQPYFPGRLQPSSYDVTLGASFKVPARHRSRCVDLADPSSYEGIMESVMTLEGFQLNPGEFVLGSTVEQFDVPSHLVMRIEGKSSLGRLGLVVHATAGYVDPGFRGRLTLEMSNWFPIPILLRPGLTIAQVSVQELTGRPRKPYDGRYQDDDDTTESRYDG